MTPLHHHFELKGNDESLIVGSFWLITLFLDPIITIMGFPPAGGCVTFKSIMNITPNATANGIFKKIGRGTKFKKIIPIKEVKK